MPLESSDSANTPSTSPETPIHIAPEDIENLTALKRTFDASAAFLEIRKPIMTPLDRIKSEAPVTDSEES